MAQTWIGSIVEAKANIALGFGINYGANIIVLPLLYDPAHVALSAFYIGLVFTAISVTRQLIIRRYFNGIAFGNTEARKPEGLNADDMTESGYTFGELAEMGKRK